MILKRVLSEGYSSKVSLKFSFSKFASTGYEDNHLDELICSN